MAKLIEYNATLTRRIDMTDKLSVFHIKPDATWGPTGDGRIPDFEAGQYIALGMNNTKDSEKGSVLRSYSIASPPENKDVFEFYIRYVDHPASDNPLTHLLWDLREGDRLHLGKKVVGHFTLSKSVGEDDPRLKVTVAAGTGLAPFLSMALSAHNRGKNVHNIAILHGASYAADLGYREELASLYSGRPELYMTSISRPQHCPEWTGPTGRIETHFSDAEKLAALEKRLGLGEGGMTPQNTVVYICGLTGTIQQTLLALLKRGFVPSDRALRKGLGLEDHAPSMFYEQYDSEPIIDIKNPEVVAEALKDSPFEKKSEGAVA